MPAPFAWLTNDPQVAAALTAADRKYEQDREAAKSLPLAAKIAALRKARDDRDAAKWMLVRGLEHRCNVFTYQPKEY